MIPPHRPSLAGSGEVRDGAASGPLGKSGHRRKRHASRFQGNSGLPANTGVKLTITSNGHSVAVLEDHELRAFHDIEFSLDYPTQAEQDAQRGVGNWELIHQQAERCVRLGVPVTIIAVMMKPNYLRLADVARVAKRFALRCV